MTTITISLRVTAPGPADARVSVGRRQFSIGRPVEFDDASPHVAALEYALGAVGGEVVNGLREFARRRRLADRRGRGARHRRTARRARLPGSDRRDRAAAHPPDRHQGFRRVGGRQGHPRAVRRDDRTPAARLHAARGPRSRRRARPDVVSQKEDLAMYRLNDEQQRIAATAAAVAERDLAPRAARRRSRRGVSRKTRSPRSARTGSSA